ncbi:MAG: 16S rRNA (cytidine(1402)-2'-O)-methyltransferase [Clostridiales bacterium]|nr:16S rRNA (cytidine(1402)-2'-O)-methyltransferase [Clostridiales bacterium]
MLYIVATPIGNLKEITHRAIEVLNSVDYIACEDTRTSKVLLDHYDIKKRLVAYHKFNEQKESKSIIDDLKQGKDIALISDAGMPGISDPGAVLVGQLIEEGLEYTVVSGPSAFTNAFVLSGYPTPMTFIGFLPDNTSDRDALLEDVAKYQSTLIFYCSPHAIEKDLQIMYNIMGDREIAVVREISKKFEEISFSTLKEGYTGVVKGEFVVLIKPKKQEKVMDIDKNLQILLDMGLTKTEASKVIAKVSGLKKGDIYKNLVTKD